MWKSNSEKKVEVICSYSNGASRGDECGVGRERPMLPTLASLSSAEWSMYTGDARETS